MNINTDVLGEESEDSARDQRWKSLLLAIVVVLNSAAIVQVYNLQWQSSGQSSFSISGPGQSVDTVGVESVARLPADSQGRSPKTTSKVPDKATHQSRLIYFGTDRSRSLPFHGTSITWLTILTFTTVAAALFLWKNLGNAKSTVPTFGLLVMTILIVGTVAWDYLPFRSRIIHEVFASGRADLQCGTCLVSVPVGHTPGMLEGPSLLHFEFRQDPDAHVVLEHVKLMTEEEFEDDLLLEADRVPWREALVFVHGYNNSFEDAARRTAQLANDLEFGGIAAFFSWPSAKETLDYTRDGQNALYAWPHLKEFLQLLANKGKLKRIHVVCHSMGNQCLAMAMRDGLDLGICKFDECILAAPDIDAQIFERDFVGNMLKQTGRLTLYASKNDHALQISRVPNGYRRLGDVDPLTVIAGMESIDVSAVDRNFFSMGHANFGDSPFLINDMRQMIDDDLRAADRADMREVAISAKLNYWELTPKETLGK